MMRKRNTFLLLILFGLLSSQSAWCQAGLQAELNAIAKQVHGNVGVYVSLVETGERVNINGSKHFPVQSVYKFPIAIAVLDAVDKGHLNENQIVEVHKSDYIPTGGHSPLRDKYPNGTKITISDLIRYSIAESDGSASDVLCRLIGGINNANAYVHRIGIKDMQISVTEKIQVAHDELQYQNWSTPAATGELFRRFLGQQLLKPQSKALLLKCLTESIPGQKRIKGLLPQGIKVAHKTGTSQTRLNGITGATNDAGVITLANGRHLIVVVFISDCSDNENKRESAIAQIAKTAYDYYVMVKD